MDLRYVVALLCGLAGPLGADESDSPAAKFTLDGSVMTYDTVNVEGQPDAEIAYDDHEHLLVLLNANPDVTTLRLNSQGGKIYAGYRMADIVIDYELSTIVDGVCSSACVYILLGGIKREMTGGSRIGFHHRSWSASSIQTYYDKWRKDEGWTTLFDFASWLYVDAQQESYEEMAYFLERGVDATFAIETMQERDGEMWYPRRSELRAAGVLTK